MSDTCPSLQELLAFAESDVDDPRRDHVRACPRCRSRLSAYGLFSSLDRQDACPGEEHAVARLTDALRDDIRSLETQPHDSMRGQSATRFSWWALRRLVPALGVAAMLAGVILILRDHLPGPSGAPVVREEPAPSPELTVSASPARALPDGSLELRWSAVAGADAYRVRILDSALEEIACHEAGPATSLLLTAEDQRAWSPRPAFWQVQALAEGDRIADSAPAEIPREPAAREPGR